MSDDSSDLSDLASLFPSDNEIELKKKDATVVDLNGLPEYTARQQLQPLIAALREKNKIIIITGAGISAASNSESLLHCQSHQLLNLIVRTYDALGKAERSLFDDNPYANKTTRTSFFKLLHEMDNAAKTAG